MCRSNLILNTISKSHLWKQFSTFYCSFFGVFSFWDFPVQWLMHMIYMVDSIRWDDVTFTGAYRVEQVIHLKALDQENTNYWNRSDRLPMPPPAKVLKKHIKVFNDDNLGHYSLAVGEAEFFGSNLWEQILTWTPILFYIGPYMDLSLIHI